MKANDLFHNRYILIRLLGRGGFGEVWLAQDSAFGGYVEVAIKIYIALSSQGLEEFQTEYLRTESFCHPNLLRVNHYAVYDSRPYIVMPYCPDSSLALICKSDEDTIWHFLHDVASGLAYIHNRNIVHRDIKPANILRRGDGRFVIADFGISIRLRNTFRRYSTRIMTDEEQIGISGAPAYMGPELYSEEPMTVKANDIWALGVTLYEIAAGELPFFGMGGAMQLHGAERPVVPGDYSQNLKDIIRDCMERETWDRPTAEQLAEYSRQIMAGAENPPKPWKREPEPATNPNSVPVPKPNRWLRMLFIIIGISLLAALSYYLWWRWKQYETHVGIVNLLDERPSDTMTVENDVADGALNEPFVDDMDDMDKLVDNYNLTEEPNYSSEESRPQQEPASTVTNKVDKKPNKVNEERKNFINGHEFVDLGLSVKWAAYNIDADNYRWFQGGYYAWGEVRLKKYYDEENYSINMESLEDDNISGDERYDVATYKWGAPWRMPTYEEMQELIEKCKWNWSGIVVDPDPKIHRGFEVTGPNGKSIFLPAGGWAKGFGVDGSNESCLYWTGNIESCLNCSNRIVDGENVTLVSMDVLNGACGMPIRPVCN